MDLHSITQVHIETAWYRLLTLLSFISACLPDYVFPYYILGSSSHKAEVLVSNSSTVRPIAFVKCSECLDVTIKFNDVQVPLYLRHNPNLPFQMVPIILLNGARNITRPNTPVVGICQMLFHGNNRLSRYKIKSQNFNKYYIYMNLKLKS